MHVHITNQEIELFYNILLLNHLWSCVLKREREGERERERERERRKEGGRNRIRFPHMDMVLVDLSVCESDKWPSDSCPF